MRSLEEATTSASAAAAAAAAAPEAAVSEAAKTAEPRLVQAPMEKAAAKEEAAI